MIRHGAVLGGHPSTAVWRIKHFFNFIIEIPTRHVVHLLPAQLAPTQPSLGLSLLNVGYMRLHAGQLKGQPEFDEITLSIHVGPDLSVDMPAPRFALFDILIGSNCKAFLNFESEQQELNGYHSPGLASTIGPSQDCVAVADEDGPILALKNTHRRPRFRFETGCAQYYSLRGTSLYQGVFQWAGTGCEHAGSGDWGQLFNHPFFQGIDVEAQVGECHTQMFLAPDAEAELYSYRPLRVE